MWNFLKFLILLLILVDILCTVNTMRTATVIAPEFIHSERKYSLSLAVNNLNISSKFDVTIESLNFKDSRAIELQPNGVQILEFDLPKLQKDEYVLRVTGEEGIFTKTAILLKFAAFKPIFVIQTDKKLYHRRETLYYKVLCLDENLKPVLPESSVDIRITTETYEIAYNIQNIKFDNFVSSGEVYLNSIGLFEFQSSKHHKARLAVFMKGELFADVDIEVMSNEVENNFKKKLKTSQPKSCRKNLIKHDYLSIVPQRSKENEGYYFKVSLAKEKVGKVLKQTEIASFKIHSSIPLRFFVYTIIGRGNIIRSERINLENETNIYEFNFKPSIQMAPLSKLIVYLIDENNNFHNDEVFFNVEGSLENKLTIKTSQPIKPNRKVEFVIETLPNSYVGLLAIEDLSDELDSCNEEINDVNIKKLLKTFGNNKLQRGEITGNVLLTTAKNIQRKDETYNKAWTEHQSDIFQQQMLPWRKSWFFAEIKNTTSDIFVLRHNLPNENTNWRVTGFSLHKEYGLGFTELESPLKTTKSYNVSFDLPGFVYAKEILCIPLEIENLIDENIQILIEFIEKDFEIELIPIYGEPNNGVQNVEIPPKTKVELKYAIRSKEAGQKYLKFLFFSTAGNDRQIIKLNVKSQGLEYAEKQFHFIDLQNFTDFHKMIRPSEQQSILSGTQYTTSTMYANLLGPVISYLREDKFKFEDFTGEQTASIMAMCCLSLRYLNSSLPELEKDLSRVMHQAYLHLIYFKRQDNGAFTFFNDLQPGQESNWLTSHILMWLPCVKEYLSIDETIIETGLDYLATTQNEGGDFLPQGPILNSKENNEILAITAHVILAFTAHKNYYDIYQTIMEKGLKYIVDNLQKSESLHSKSLAVYALYRANYSDLEKELEKFKSFILKEDEYEYWAEGNYENINNIATTSFLLLASIGRNFDMNIFLEKSIKWLLEKGSLYNYRGLYPIQSSVLSLEVLTSFMKQKNITTNVDFTLSHQGLFHIEHKDFEVLNGVINQERFEFYSQSGQLELSAFGEGYSLAYVGFNYNILKPSNEQKFSIIIERPSYGFLISFMLNTCVQYESYKPEADLTVLQIIIPSGYIIKEDQLLKLMEKESLVKHALIDENQNSVKLFLVGLPRYERKCFSLELLRMHAIAKQAEVPVYCYEYTDPMNMAINYYNIEVNTCDLCEGETECVRNCQFYN